MYSNIICLYSLRSFDQFRVLWGVHWLTEEVLSLMLRATILNLNNRTKTKQMLHEKIYGQIYSSNTLWDNINCIKLDDCERRQKDCIMIKKYSCITEIKTTIWVFILMSVPWHRGSVGEPRAPPPASSGGTHTTGSSSAEPAPTQDEQTSPGG